MILLCGIILKKILENKNFKIKKIIRKLEIPKLKKKKINFLNWFSEYNIVPKGMALKLTLLSGRPVKKKNRCCVGLLINNKFYKDFKKENIRFFKLLS